MKEGKIRFIGVSNMSTERIRQSLHASKENGFTQYQTLQPLYNLMEREAYEKELRSIAEENNMGVLNYSSLASGFLTGKYRDPKDLDKSERGGNVEKYLSQRGFTVLEALDVCAKKHSSTPATISLAWLLNRPTITAPIVSATSIKQLQSIIQAPQLKLDTQDMELLNKASSWK